MPSLSPKDRVSLCRFTFSDHRQCRTPRSADHPHFCFFHARQESRSRTADNLANDLSYFFSGRYLSANDLCAALGRLIPAVARGDIKPRTASTLAYLAQTMVQAVQLAEKEYIYAFGTPAWGEEIRNNAAGNFERINEDANNDADNSNAEEGAHSEAACEKDSPEDSSSGHTPQKETEAARTSEAGRSKPATENPSPSTVPSRLPTVDSMPLTNPPSPLEATLTKI